MQLEQHFHVFNMRHVKHVEIIVWYVADTPLTFPYRAYKQTDRGKSRHTFRLYLYDYSLEYSMPNADIRDVFKMYF